MLLNPLGDLRKVFVFLADIILFTQVDEVDDRFGGEEK